MAQWDVRLTRNVEVVGSSPIKGLEQETLPLLISTGWFHNGFESAFTIELKSTEGLMED